MTEGTLPEGTNEPKCARCGLAPSAYVHECNCCHAFVQPSEPKCATCGVCGHPAVHDNEGPRDKMGFHHTDKCPMCDCLSGYGTSNACAAATAPFVQPSETANSEPTIELSSPDSSRTVGYFHAGRTIECGHCHPDKYTPTNAACCVCHDRAAVAPSPLPTPECDAAVQSGFGGWRPCRNRLPCAEHPIEQTPTETDEEAFAKFLRAHNTDASGPHGDHCLEGAWRACLAYARRSAQPTEELTHAHYLAGYRAGCRAAAQPTAESIDVQGIARTIADRIAYSRLSAQYPRAIEEVGEIIADELSRVLNERSQQ